MDETEYFLIIETEREDDPPARAIFGPMQLEAFRATYDAMTDPQAAENNQAPRTLYAAKIVYHEHREPNRAPVVNPRRRARDPKPTPSNAV